MTKLFTSFSLTIAMGVTSNAATTLFTDQGSFLAAISSPYIETFNGINEPGLYPGPIPFSSFPYSYSATQSISGFFNAGSPFPGDVWLSTNDSASTISFTFTGGNIFGVGAYFFSSDFNGQAVTGSMNVSLNGGPPEVVNASSPSSFRGFVSDSAISSLSLSAIQPGAGFLWPTVNDLIVGGSAVSVVPEPASALATVVLMAGGLCIRLREKAGLKN